MEHQILLVDDNPGMIQLMGRILSGFGQRRFATIGAATLRQMRESPPDLMHSAAKLAGWVQAWQLDIDDFDAGAMAREIPSPGHEARRRVVA